jgi:hypothetical protein
MISIWLDIPVSYQLDIMVFLSDQINSLTKTQTRQINPSMGISFTVVGFNSLIILFYALKSLPGTCLFS